MRILHTGDWHVGRTLRGRSRAAEHRAVLDEIAGIARDRAVDAVLVAGDVFDNSAPTAESEAIVYEALLALAETDAHVVLIAGNHDHPGRLGAVRPLLELGRVTVQSTLVRPQDGGLIHVRGRSGETARIALLPFLSQRGIISADVLMDEDADRRVLKYADRYEKLVRALCASFDEDAINLVLAHATVFGARLGGGEREAHTIFDYAVPAAVFPVTAHYVALGHLHRTQRVEAACPVWYSGAPMQLDFGEAGNEGAVLLVDAEPGTPARVERIPVTSGRPLRTLRGTLDALAAMTDDVGEAMLRVIVDEAPRSGLADEVRASFPNAVEVTVAPHLEDEPEQEEWSLDAMRHSPIDLFEEYLAAKRIKDRDALTRLFRSLLEEAVAPDASGD